ncbi:MAG: hypothetical protein GY928_18540 [Colwellia sp.]|nr:hypothetical protein [Colwellia sp.]
MSEGGLSKEKAKWFEDLHYGRVEIKDPVYLKTTHVSDGKVVYSKVLEREFLESWLERATRENSQDCVKWELVLEKGEDSE